jgi:hypothetical protein
MVFIKAQGSTDEALIVVSQRLDSESDFGLVEPFRWEGSHVVDVLPAKLPTTDLASIPWFLRWFVSPFGRHTAAALLHDYLMQEGPHEQPPIVRRDADGIFLEGLTELKVAPARRRIMWAGVTLATRSIGRWWERLGVYAWILAAFVGTVTLVFAAVTGRWWLVAIAALAPVPSALLWGSQAFAGLIAGYAFVLVALPTVAILLAYCAYSLVEILIRLLRRLKRANRGKPLPGPPKYTKL